MLVGEGELPFSDVFLICNSWPLLMRSVILSVVSDLLLTPAPGSVDTCVFTVNR